MHLLAPRRSALTAIDGLSTTVSRGVEACDAKAAQRLVETVLARALEDDHDLLVVVIDDVDELAEASRAPRWRRSSGAGATSTSASSPHARRRPARALLRRSLRELRKDGSGLLLAPNLDMDGEILGVRLPRRTTLVFPPGRGFLIGGALPVLVQVAAEQA